METTDNDIRFRLLIENSTDMISMLDAQGKIIYESPSIERTLGFLPEDSSDYSIFERIHQEDLRKVKELFNKAMDRPGDPVFLETRLQTKGGEYVFAEGTFNNLLHVPGMLAIVSNFKDITERKIAELSVQRFNQLLEEQVHLKTEELRKIFERITDAFIALDKNWCYTYMNKKAGEIFGCDPAVMIGKNFWSHFSQDHNQALYQAYQKAFNEQQYIPLDEYYPNFDKWIENHIYPSPEGISVFLQDITSKKKSEQALQQAYQQIYYHISNTPLAIIEVDKDLCLLQWSKKAEDLFGWKASEVLGKNINSFNLIDSRDTEKVTSMMNELLSGAKNSNSSINLNTSKSGKTLNCEWYNSVLRDEKGNITAILSFAQDITERLRAESEIKESREQYTSLVNSINGIVWEAEPETFTFNFVSAQAEKILGYPPRLWTGSPSFWIKHIHPEDRNWVIDYCKKCTLGNKNHELEYRMIAADGRLVWLHNFVTVISKDNQPVQLKGLMIDITPRKLIEKELLHSQHQLDLIYNSILDPMWLINIEGPGRYRFEAINTAFTEISGLTKEKTLNKLIEDVLPVGSHHIVRTKYREAVRSGKTIEYQEVADLPAGKKTADIKVIPIKNEHGEVKKILGIAHDITAEVEAEKALRKSEAHLRSILANTDTGYALIDRQFCILSFNEPLAKIAREGLLLVPETGKLLTDYITPPRKEFVIRQLNKALKGEDVSYEVSYPHSDGSDRWYNMRMFPIIDHSRARKRIFGILVALTDITKHKLGELYRETITSNLLQRNKDLEQFTYIISHNLRSPLANIKGLSDILQDPHLPDNERNEMMRALSISVKNLDEVIVDLNQILDIKKQLNDKKEIVQFSKLVHDVKVSIDQLIEREQVTIHTDFTEVDEMRTIKGYLYSIFFNLISNSIKFRKPEVRPVIEIKSKREGNHILLSIKDNGMGIELSKRRGQVFGLYNRFHSQIEGKGMGLYMVKMQVESLGGTISLKSRVNEGTEFIIDFENSA